MVSIKEVKEMPAGTSYLVKEGMFGRRMTCEQREGEKYYRFEMKNNFLHAVHPLGWFKHIEIQIDGVLIPEEEAFLVLRNQWFRVSDIHTISEVFWNLCEPLAVYIKGGWELALGVHKVKVTFRTSLLEDTRILDLDGKYEERVEFAEADIELV